ncbi:MAG: type II toxin-antitoxin system VapC family toxin [Armatimonadota bacterium]
MSTFIDTSAFIAFLVDENQNHKSASETWRQLLETDDHLITSNYITVETCALLQRRIGMHAVKIFIEDVLPVVTIEWVDSTLHDDGVNGLMMSGKSGPNIVDCVSFAVMRRHAIKNAFTFDRHFSDQGFVVL